MSQKLLDLQGATALVTGASSGIGAVTAVTLARAGVTVGLVARRRDRLEAVLSACQEHAPASRYWCADLADPDTAAQLVVDAWETFGHLDVLVNNAAIPMRRHLLRATTQELDHTMRVNFQSPVRMAMTAIPLMLDHGSGVVVNVSSFGGRAGIPGETAYCASKFALCGWTEAAALDLWRTAVRIRLIIPGAIDTEIWHVEGSDPPDYDGPLEPPQTVADGIVTAINSDRFEHYLPDMRDIVAFKTTDIDLYLEGAESMVTHTAAEPGPEPGE